MINNIFPPSDAYDVIFLYSCSENACREAAKQVDIFEIHECSGLNMRQRICPELFPSIGFIIYSEYLVPNDVGR